MDPERLAQRLGVWITDRLRADGVVDDDADVQVELGPGPTSGNSNVTLPLAAHWHSAGQARSTELVLRMQVPTNQIFLDTDVLREHRVLSALDAVTTLPTPTPCWAESDPAVLGQPFFVMERVRGVVPAGTPSIHVTGWLSERTPEECRTAWESAMAAVVAIHDVDWRETLPFLTEAAVGATLETRLGHISDWYEWSCAGREFAVTDAALRYLREELPHLEPVPAVLVWGDARVGNVMFGDDHRVAAVLDWELASIGPAAIDLGWWLAMDEFQTTAHGITPVPGYPGREETIAFYEHATGRTVPDLRWFEVLCAFVLTVTVIRMADIAVAAGRLSPDNRMGHGNLTAQMLARWLDLPVPALDPAYAARRGLDAG
jgi:aminoglycoside phosphotransferase (APT) family kinase protein